MSNWDDLETMTKNEMILDGLADYVRHRIERVRLGIYSEERDGTLLEVLEEIEGMIR